MLLQFRLCIGYGLLWSYYERSIPFYKHSLAGFWRFRLPVFFLVTAYTTTMCHYSHHTQYVHCEHAYNHHCSLWIFCMLCLVLYEAALTSTIVYIVYVYCGLLSYGMFSANVLAAQRYIALGLTNTHIFIALHSTYIRARDVRVKRCFFFLYTVVIPLFFCFSLLLHFQFSLCLKICFRFYLLVLSFICPHLHFTNEMGARCAVYVSALLIIVYTSPSVGN